MFKELWQNLWVRVGVTFAAVAGGFAVICSLRAVLLPFVISFVLAYLFDPVVDFFERRKIPRTGGIVILILVLLLVLTGFLLVLVPMIVDQVRQLFAVLPKVLDLAATKAVPLLREHFNIEIPHTTTEFLDQIKGSFTYLQNLTWDNFSPVGTALKSAFSGMAGVIAVIVNFLVIPVVTFYLLHDFDAIKAEVFSWIPRRFQPVSYRYFEEIDSVLSNFVRGQLTVAAILAVLYITGLWIAGIPLWALIGTVAGGLSFVPYLGFLVGFVPSIVMALVEYHDIRHIVYVVIVFSVVQGLEGTFITPRIVGNKLGLHPVVVMFAVILGGRTYGVAGIVLAIPLFAVLSVFFRAFRQWYFTSTFYGPGGGTSAPSAPAASVTDHQSVPVVAATGNQPSRKKKKAP